MPAESCQKTVRLPRQNRPSITLRQRRSRPAHLPSRLQLRLNHVCFSLVRHAGSTCTTPVGPDTVLSDLQHNLAKRTGTVLRVCRNALGCERYWVWLPFAGVPAEAQLLICCAIKLQAGPVLPQIPAGCTVSLLGRLRGGSSTVNITLQPRVQKDKWSMYWRKHGHQDRSA